MGKKGVSHVFDRIFLHITWHCIHDQPQIIPAIESVLYRHIEDYCTKIDGVHFKGVGGTPTHVHLVVQLEPFVLVSTFIGELKGGSSHRINHQFGNDTLKWQRGYGVVSFAHKHLDSVIRYVQNQKEHHAKRTTNEILETFVREMKQYS